MRNPTQLWFLSGLLAAGLLALLCGRIFYVHEINARSLATLSESARQELAALHVRPARSAQVEREWVATGFVTELLIAPVGPMPCSPAADLIEYSHRPAAREAFQVAGQDDAGARIEHLASIVDRDPANLLVVLMLGTELDNAGRYGDAYHVIETALDRTQADERTIISSKAPGSKIDLADIDMSLVIHLYHAQGVADLLAASSPQPPWKPLKNVIGSVNALSHRRLMGSSRGGPTWSRLQIPAPGCAASTSASGTPLLSSYDLFNNLIVGYMKGDFVGGENEREREFSRPTASMPSPLLRLLQAQVRIAAENNWKNESQLWALSNAQQVADWQVPDDARIDVNTIHVINWWTSSEHCPPSVCTHDLLEDLQKTRDRLLEQAFLRHNVAPDQRAVFARGITRLLADSRLDRSKLEDGAAAIRSGLTPDQAAQLDHLITADAARAKLPQWLVGPRDDMEDPVQPLGRYAGRWRDAAVSDYVATAAEWVAGRSAAEQRHALIALRQLIGSGDVPPELAALEAQRSWTDRLGMRLAASRLWWGFLAAAVAAISWLIVTWGLIQYRDWRLLRTSFYNVELEHLRGSERPTRPVRPARPIR